MNDFAFLMFVERHKYGRPLTEAEEALARYNVAQTLGLEPAYVEFRAELSRYVGA